jgi:hypothetical protein
VVIVDESELMYHVMSQGDRRKDIFLKDVDRQDFIKTSAEAPADADSWTRMFYRLFKRHSGLPPL